jgi:hypothetical protein
MTRPMHILTFDIDGFTCWKTTRRKRRISGTNLLPAFTGMLTGSYSFCRIPACMLHFSAWAGLQRPIRTQSGKFMLQATKSGLTRMVTNSRTSKTRYNSSRT